MTDANRARRVRKPAMTATQTDSEQISWRESRDRFCVAKYAEQQMYSRAVAHYERSPGLL
jgi:hypothetical protein